MTGAAQRQSGTAAQPSDAAGGAPGGGTACQRPACAGSRGWDGAKFLPFLPLPSYLTNAFGKFNTSGNCFHFRRKKLKRP